MKIRFFDIDWDTDGDEEIKKTLPKSVELEVGEIDVGAIATGRGADVLSDTYGFCVFSFDFELANRVWAVVNTVEGTAIQVELAKTLQKAKDLVVELAKEQCDSTEEEIRAELEIDLNFHSRNSDVVISIFDTLLDS